MKILIGMAHPKHVYMFKNFIRDMSARGHQIKTVTIDKDFTEYLLNRFCLPYTSIGVNSPKLYKKILGMPTWEYNTFKIAREFKPDIYLGQALPYLAHISAVFRKPYILLEDSEPAYMVQSVSFPFANNIITPACYKDDLGAKQIRFNGYFELAYLHPNHFNPDFSVLDSLGLNKKDKFVVMRFVSWTAIHDIGQAGGYSSDIKERIIDELEEHCQVFITSERPLSGKFKKYSVKVPPEKIHDLLYFANMLIGDSQTMTSEAGILGTPAIRCNSFVGENDMGNFVELEEKYRLIFNYSDPEQAKNKAIELIHKSGLKEEWRIKKERLLSEKGDFNRFLIEFIEKYGTQ